MLINGTDIAQFNARQHKVVYSYPERDVSSEWPTGGANPTFHRNLPGMETMTLELIVKGEGREKIRSNIRRLLGLFDTPCVNVYLTGGGWFLGTLQNSAAQETSPERWHKLTLSLRGIAYREIVGAGMRKRLPASVNIDAVPVAGCQAILTLRAEADTETKVYISGLARDRRGKEAEISFSLSLLAGVETTVFIGELPMGIPFFEARENPTLLSFSDGTPLAGEVGAAPRLQQGRNTISVRAEETGITCDLTVYYLSAVKEEGD